MSAPRYTPGPWSVEPGYAPVVLGPDGGRVADVTTSRGAATDQANARLVATAPELVAAAEHLLNHLDARIDQAVERREPVPVFVGLSDLRAAVRRAKGGGS